MSCPSPRLSSGPPLLGTSLRRLCNVREGDPFEEADEVHLHLFGGTLRLPSLTNSGVVVGQIFVMWLGAGLMTSTFANQDFADAYAVAGIGGVMDQSFQ